MHTTIESSDFNSILYMVVSPPKIDWAQLINDLIARGIGPTRQAEILGRQQSTLQRWQKGAEPRFKYGHALITLHQKVCGPELTQSRLLNE